MISTRFYRSTTSIRRAGPVYEKRRDGTAFFGSTTSVRRAHRDAKSGVPQEKASGLPPDKARAVRPELQSFLAGGERFAAAMCDAGDER